MHCVDWQRQSRLPLYGTEFDKEANVIALAIVIGIFCLGSTGSAFVVGDFRRIDILLGQVCDDRVKRFIMVGSRPCSRQRRLALSSESNHPHPVIETFAMREHRIM